MGIARRYPYLAMIVFAKFHTHILTISGRLRVNVCSDIKYCAAGDADQFALWLALQKMESTQHPVARTGVVVLHKGQRYADHFCITLGAEGFLEKTAVITKHFGFNNFDAS